MLSRLAVLCALAVLDAETAVAFAVSLMPDKEFRTDAIIAPFLQ
jgi:hypothetical protein